MDVLDLSLDEKRSRRKANMPQRRQGGGQLVVADERKIEESETENHQNGKFQNNNLEELESRPDGASLNVQKEFSEADTYGSRDKVVLGAPLSYNPSSSRCSTPSDPDEKESLGQSFNGSNPSSPAELIKKKILSHSSQPPFSYHANTNNNSNRSVSLTRFPQLPSNTASSLPSAVADLSAFQERFGLPSSSPHALIRSHIKSSPHLPYSSYDVQPIDTPGIPERTKKQNRWAFNVWREWARKRNITVSRLIRYLITGLA